MLKTSFHAAFSHVRNYYSDAEIARKLDLPRQTINSWHGISSKPQRRNLAKLMQLYESLIDPKTDQDLLHLLIDKYGPNWPIGGVAKLRFELKQFPAQFIRRRLMWLVQDGVFVFQNTDRNGTEGKVVNGLELPFVKDVKTLLQMLRNDEQV